MSCNFGYLAMLLAILGNYIRIVHTEDVLTSPIVTNKGDWGEFENCTDDTKVIAFQLKTEPWNAWNAAFDDTSLNSIKLYCGYPSLNPTMPGEIIHTIQSSEGDWGKWGKVFHCDGSGYAQGFMLRSEEEGTAWMDDTAANNLRILCNNGTQFIEGDGETWGEWTTPRICKSSEYMCGLQTQIEPPQGFFGDDTALNNIRVKCCDL